MNENRNQLQQPSLILLKDENKSTGRSTARRTIDFWIKLIGRTMTHAGGEDSSEESVSVGSSRKSTRKQSNSCESEILYSLCILVGLLGIAWAAVFVFVTYTRIFFNFESRTTLDDIFALVYHTVVWMGTFVLPFTIRYCMLPHLRPGSFIRTLIAVIMGLMNQGYVAVCATRAALIFRALEYWSCEIAWDLDECEARSTYFQVRFILDTVGASIGAFCTVLLPAAYLTLQRDDNEEGSATGSQGIEVFQTYRLPPPPACIAVSGPPVQSDQIHAPPSHAEHGNCTGEGRIYRQANERVWVAIPGGSLASHGKPACADGIKGARHEGKQWGKDRSSRDRVGSSDSDAFLISGSNSDDSERDPSGRFSSHRPTINLRKDDGKRGRVNSADSEARLICGSSPDNLDQCPVCEDYATAVILNCGHAFCHSCVGPFAKMLSCPKCGQLITHRRLIDQLSVF